MKATIIPAIDLIDGKCVRLTQGDYAQKKEYNDNPLEVAKMFEGAGITRLHLVDLDGAKNKKVTNQHVLEAITSGTNLKVDFGGGIQSDEDIQLAFDCGAEQVTGGSIAIKDPELFMSWVEKYGNEKIILGADARDGKVAVSGWQEVTEVSLVEMIDKYFRKGLKHVISTDVAKDGLLQGPSFDMYHDLILTFPNMHIIASGGVSNMKDIIQLSNIGVDGVIVGKAFYEGKISLKEFEEYHAH